MGLRRSEVCNLATEDVDLDRRELVVSASKNKDWRVLKLRPSVLAYLPKNPPAGGYYCVNTQKKPWKPNAITLCFARHRKRMGAKWSDVSFRTPRHTCASQMAISGKFTLYQIAKFMGHRSVQTTQQYAHLLPSQVEPNW